MAFFDEADGRLDDLDLERDQTGAFVPARGGRATGCDADTDRCAQDDDAGSESRHVPGTPDDRPTRIREDGAEPADLLGTVERELGEEDALESVRLPWENEDEARETMSALGDDAADALPDSPEGVSATGSADTPEHGGFPERE